MLANPDTIKSILAGDFAGNGIDLSGIAYNPEDVAGTRMQVKDAIMGALTQVANEGYAEKERKRKKRNNPSSTPSSPKGGKDYAERWADVDNDQNVGVSYNIGGHKVKRDSENPDIYYVDGIAFPSRQMAYDAVTD